MNSANNPHRATLPVTLILLQGWEISYSVVFPILSVTVLHRVKLVSVVETYSFTSSPDQIMLPEVLACCDHFNKTVSTFLLFVDHKLFIFGSSGMKISCKCKNTIIHLSYLTSHYFLTLKLFLHTILDIIFEKASPCVDTLFPCRVP